MSTYCPQGVIDTDELSQKEAHIVTTTLTSEALNQAVPNFSKIPDTFSYYVNFQQDDGSVIEASVSEGSLSSEVREVLQLLINKIVESSQSG